MQVARICLYITASAFLVMLSLFAWYAIILEKELTSTVHALPTIIDTRAAAIQADLKVAESDFNSNLNSNLHSAIFLADNQATKFRSESLQTVRISVDKGISGLSDKIDFALKPVYSTQTDLAATLDRVNTLLDTANATALDLKPQLTGLTKDARFTMAETGRAAGSIQRALPSLLKTTEDIGADIKKTTEASVTASQHTSEVMEHMAEATKPLPTWIKFIPGSAKTIESIVAILVLIGAL